MRDTDHQLEDPSMVRPWRQGIQFGLIIAAAGLLLSRPYLIKAIRENIFSAEWLLVGPILFLLLFLTYLAFEFFSTRRSSFSLSDYIQASFGLLIIALSFPSSLREYRVRKIPDPMSVQLIENFSKDKDARIRALSILASSRHNFDEQALGALIHRGLLDNDPLVQQAAKLVIEENFGIRLKNGAEGIHQAKSFIQDVSSQASLIRKGSP